MIITKPEKIVFETQNDIIDYVGRGLPPTKKNFSKLKNAIKDANNLREQDSEDYLSTYEDLYGDKIAGKDVIVSPHLMLNIDDETFNNILDRMYKNRVRTCKITLGVVCIAALALAVGGCKSSKKENDDIDEFDIEEL